MLKSTIPGTEASPPGLNGVPHLSVLDGWWVEGFNGKNGWAVEHDGSSASPDGSDAENIYRILEDEIIPLNYKMSESSIPHQWVRLMKESIKSNVAEFSARRMVKQYIENVLFQKHGRGFEGLARKWKNRLPYCRISGGREN
jgi:glycogen phosphorylase